MNARLKRLLLAAVLLCASPAFAVTANLTGYVGVTNGIDPRTTQTFTTPAGETGTVNITVKNPDGSAYNLTGAQLLLTVRDRNNVIIVSRQGTINSPATGGTGFFPLVIADTVGLSSFGNVAYYYDVWVTDSSGNRWAAVITSTFQVTRAQGQPAQQVTVPATQTPLAQGPAGLGLSRTAQTTTYAARFMDYVAANATSGAFTVTLPATSGIVGTSNIVYVKNIGTANSVTVAPAGGDTIDIGTIALAPGEVMPVIAHAGQWEALP